jgi:hypothetical protein
MDGPAAVAAVVPLAKVVEEVAKLLVDRASRTCKRARTMSTREPWHALAPTQAYSSSSHGPGASTDEFGVAGASTQGEDDEGEIVD